MKTFLMSLIATSSYQKAHLSWLGPRFVLYHATPAAFPPFCLLPPSCFLGVKIICTSKMVIAHPTPLTKGRNTLIWWPFLPWKKTPIQTPPVFSALFSDGPPSNPDGNHKLENVNYLFVISGEDERAKGGRGRCGSRLCSISPGSPLSVHLTGPNFTSSFAMLSFPACEMYHTCTWHDMYSADASMAFFTAHLCRSPGAINTLVGDEVTITPR
ncbi:hypothetical protein E2C01_037064 [Portunus trituberculatus]|uniref:Uncharacterized protein n=1 Tax=Portunus trituberculatus TaxID=210409 RepID=A0A5B7FCZ0_PORTR|nr:hypothetical protein [Portunus trituberculatus]